MVPQITNSPFNLFPATSTQESLQDGFLRGKVAYLLADDCLLDVGGVGYRVTVSGMTRSKLRQGEHAMLFTYLSVREDALQLYGFATQEEYDVFLQLIGVSGK